MLDAFKSLPDDPARLKGLVSRMDPEITSLTYQVEKLKAELAGHRKARFGSRSESLDQLALDLQDDEEIEAAAEAQQAEQSSGDDEEAASNKPRAKRKHNRTPLPDHLDRQDEVLSTGEDCSACGGSLRQIGEDVTEELEYVPGRFVVRRILRPAWPAPAVKPLPRPHCRRAHRTWPPRSGSAGPRPDWQILRSPAA